MNYDAILRECEDAMQKAIDHLRKEFKSVRTGRASTGLVENIQADYYGSKQPIKNMANINVADATSLTIKPYDKGVLQVIAKAIMEANIGLNPVDDGLQIRINLPPMTGETRKKLANQVKDLGEKCKVTIRNARQDANKNADSELKAKQSSLTEDDHRALKDEIQGKTDKFNKLIDQEVKTKTDEIMSV